MVIPLSATDNAQDYRGESNRDLQTSSGSQNLHYRTNFGKERGYKPPLTANGAVPNAMATTGASNGKVGGRSGRYSLVQRAIMETRRRRLNATSASAKSMDTPTDIDVPSSTDNEKTLGVHGSQDYQEEVQNTIFQASQRIGDAATAWTATRQEDEDLSIATTTSTLSHNKPVVPSTNIVSAAEEPADDSESNEGLKMIGQFSMMRVEDERQEERKTNNSFRFRLDEEIKINDDLLGSGSQDGSSQPESREMDETSTEDDSTRNNNSFKNDSEQEASVETATLSGLQPPPLRGLLKTSSLSSQSSCAQLPKRSTGVSFMSEYTIHHFQSEYSQEEAWDEQSGEEENNEDKADEESLFEAEMTKAWKDILWVDQTSSKPKQRHRRRRDRRARGQRATGNRHSSRRHQAQETTKNQTNRDGVHGQSKSSTTTESDSWSGIWGAMESGVRTFSLALGLVPEDDGTETEFRSSQPSNIFCGQSSTATRLEARSLSQVDSRGSDSATIQRGSKRSDEGLQSLVEYANDFLLYGGDSMDSYSDSVEHLRSPSDVVDSDEEESEVDERRQPPARGGNGRISAIPCCNASPDEVEMLCKQARKNRCGHDSGSLQDSMLLPTDFEFQIAEFSLPLGLVFVENNAGCFVQTVAKAERGSACSIVKVGDQLGAIEGISCAGITVEEVQARVHAAIAMSHRHIVQLVMVRYIGPEIRKNAKRSRDQDSIDGPEMMTVRAAPDSLSKPIQIKSGKRSGIRSWFGGRNRKKAKKAQGTNIK